jgi:hypothetical protein
MKLSLSQQVLQPPPQTQQPQEHQQLIQTPSVSILSILQTSSRLLRQLILIHRQEESLTAMCQLPMADNPCFLFTHLPLILLLLALGTVFELG